MDGLFDTVFGLPTHALVVHVVVVLLPLTAVAAIVMVVWPSFSRRFGSLIMVVAAAAAATSFVAKESGEALAERVGMPTQHASLGDVMPLIAAGFFVILLVFWLFDRGIPANRSRPGWLIALGVLLVLASLVTIGWAVQTGHTGAEAVWTSIVSNTSPRG